MHFVATDSIDENVARVIQRAQDRWTQRERQPASTFWRRMSTPRQED